MPARHVTHAQKTRMKSVLHNRCRSGAWPSGTMVPPLRALAAEFEVSKEAATQVLRDLANDGLLLIVPNVGTFVGHVPTDEREFYLFLLPDVETLASSTDRHRLQVGFETRISELGGASLSLKCSQAIEARQKGVLPRYAGVFNLAYGEGQGQWPRDPSVGEVRFGNENSHVPPIDLETDTVNYDNEGGAYLATRHLLDEGHQRIAFLGVHPPGAILENTTAFKWSVARESGWCRALTEANQEILPIWAPSSELLTDWAQVHRVMRDVSHDMLHAGMFDGTNALEAIVAANDLVAKTLLETLIENGVPRAKWPAIVGFDNTAHQHGHVISSLELPTEQIGVVAAEILWERRRGLLGSSPVARYVPMRLVARLSSRPQWSIATIASHLLSSPSLPVPVV